MFQQWEVVIGNCLLLSGNPLQPWTVIPLPFGQMGYRQYSNFEFEGERNREIGVVSWLQVLKI